MQRVPPKRKTSIDGTDVIVDSLGHAFGRAHESYLVAYRMCVQTQNIIFQWGSTTLGVFRSKVDKGCHSVRHIAENAENVNNARVQEMVSTLELKSRAWQDWTRWRIW